jgi:uncharacterized phiE125 gp8 family phage protein
MNLVQITPPDKDPVTLQEAKVQLRVDHTADDSIIADLIKVATAMVEQESLHKLITQTWDLFMDTWPSLPLELPYPPLQGITGIYYTPDGEAESTWDSSNYLVDTNSKPGRIALTTAGTLPSDALQALSAVRIRFTCGMGEALDDIDPRARQALLLALGHLYENRESIVIDRGITMAELPMGFHYLLADLRYQVITL